jgi:hypothetical protein
MWGLWDFIFFFVYFVEDICIRKLLPKPVQAHTQNISSDDNLVLSNQLMMDSIMDPPILLIEHSLFCLCDECRKEYEKHEKKKEKHICNGTCVLWHDLLPQQASRLRRRNSE